MQAHSETITHIISIVTLAICVLAGYHIGQKVLNKRDSAPRTKHKK